MLARPLRPLFIIHHKPELHFHKCKKFLIYVLVFAQTENLLSKRQPLACSQLAIVWFSVCGSVLMIRLAVQLAFPKRVPIGDVDHVTSLLLHVQILIRLSNKDEL